MITRGYLDLLLMFKNGELIQYDLGFKMDNAIRVYSKGNIIEIFKAKGAGPELMNYSMYQTLLAGENVVLNKDYFVPDLANGMVAIIKRKFTIQVGPFPKSIKIDSGSPAFSETSSQSVSIIPYVAPQLALVVYKPFP